MTHLPSTHASHTLLLLHTAHDGPCNGLPLLCTCSEGGTSIEDLAEKFPEKIIKLPVDIRTGLTDDQVQQPPASAAVHATHTHTRARVAAYITDTPGSSCCGRMCWLLVLATCSSPHTIQDNNTSTPPPTHLISPYHHHHHHHDSILPPPSRRRRMCATLMCTINPSGAADGAWAGRPW